MNCDQHASLREVGRLASLYFWLAEFLLRKRAENRVPDQVAGCLEAASLVEGADLALTELHLCKSLKRLERLRDCPEMQSSKVLTGGEGVPRDCVVLFVDGLTRMRHLLERSPAPSPPPHVVRSRWLTELAAACLHPGFRTAQESEDHVASSQEQSVWRILLLALSHARDAGETMEPIDRLSALKMIGVLQIEMNSVRVRAKAQGRAQQLVLEVLEVTESCLDDRIASLG